MDRYIGKFLDNRYEILEVIGTGGMAVVYKARCHRLNRYVAVKILKDEHLRDAEFRRRFHDESQAVAMLSHPNIVSVYDVSSSGGIEYIVMELIDGITLKEYMKRKGVLSWKETLYFATQTARALGHAHSRGIIHRDIKPHNIMLLRDGTIKVADFGIARLMMQKQASLTQEAIGSVHYVAPEQAKGSFIDARADIYSLGVVMYEMLTGRLPFEGDTPVAVAMQHISAIPLMPREINPAIPEAMEAITMKAMNPSLAKRYASASEMLGDLESFRANPDMAAPFIVRPDHMDDRTDEDKTVSLTEISDQIVNTPSRRAVLASQRGLVKAPQGGKRNAPAPAPRQQSGKGGGRAGSSLMIGFIVIIGFFVGAVYFAWHLLGIGLAGPESTKIPPLTGLLLADVLANKEYTDNFDIVEKAQMYHDTLPDGTIISQYPDAGRQSKVGATIEVTVSRGQKTVTLPDFRNFEYALAEVALGRLDLLFREEYEVSETVAKGYVIRTVPGASQTIKEGDIVTLVISQGKTVETAIVPDVMGKYEVEARLAIEKAGLMVGTVNTVEHDGTEGVILFQSIAAEEEVPEKTPIDLTVSIKPLSIPSQGGTTPLPPDNPPPGNGGTGNGTVTPPPAPELKDYNLKINLERYKGEVRVTVKLNGVIVYDQMVNATESKMLYVPIRGTGTGYVYVYVDNKSIAEQPVVFE